MQVFAEFEDGRKDELEESAQEGEDADIDEQDSVELTVLRILHPPITSGRKCTRSTLSISAKHDKRKTTLQRWPSDTSILSSPSCCLRKGEGIVRDINAELCRFCRGGKRLKRSTSSSAILSPSIPSTHQQSLHSPAAPGKGEISSADEEIYYTPPKHNNFQQQYFHPPFGLTVHRNCSETEICGEDMDIPSRRSHQKVLPVRKVSLTLDSSDSDCYLPHVSTSILPEGDIVRNMSADNQKSFLKRATTQSTTMSKEAVVKKWARQYVRRMRGKGGRKLKRPSAASSLFTGLATLFGVHYPILQREHLWMVCGTYAASSTLIFSSPNSPSSQPRALIGGHVIGGLVGLLFKYALLSFGLHPLVPCALAILVSLLLMSLTHTMHPPGISASIATILTSYGPLFVLVPILTGPLCVLLIAVLVTNLSKRRRYPVSWW